MFVPTNEENLIETREFIAQAPAKVEELTEVLRIINLHYVMLDEFSFQYKETDIEQFWFMKIWPLKIVAALTEGKNTMSEKVESFSARLEIEKEQFSK